MHCRPPRIRSSLQLFSSRRSSERCFTSGGPDKTLRCSNYHRIENRGQGQGKFATLELDLVTVKGKTESETIYTLLGREEVASDIRFQELRKLWSTMIYCYRSRDWEGALEAIELCRSAEHNFGLGMLFDLYWTRIQAFQASAPPADWTGVFVAETK